MRYGLVVLGFVFACQSQQDSPRQNHKLASIVPTGSVTSSPLVEDYVLQLNELPLVPSSVGVATSRLLEIHSDLSDKQASNAYYQWLATARKVTTELRGSPGALQKHFAKGNLAKNGLESIFVDGQVSDVRIDTDYIRGKFSAILPQQERKFLALRARLSPAFEGKMFIGNVSNIAALARGFGDLAKQHPSHFHSSEIQKLHKQHLALLIRLTSLTDDQRRQDWLSFRKELWTALHLLSSDAEYGKVITDFRTQMGLGEEPHSLSATSAFLTARGLN